MGEIINLNKARKARARDEKEQRAAENRVKFGRTKAEKLALKAEDERAHRAHSGQKLDKPESDT